VEPEKKSSEHAIECARRAPAEIERLRDGLRSMVAQYESEYDHDAPVRPAWLVELLMVPNKD
jgi:hypothetical protein